MQATKQLFPPVTLEALPNGLFRVEDETSVDGIIAVDLHPTQVQVLAAMVGFQLPDRARKALGRVLERVKALSEQATWLEEQLELALGEGLSVGSELVAGRFIAISLAQLGKDLGDLAAPDLEPLPDALANLGGQLALV